MRAMAMIDITLSLARPKDAPSLALMSRDLIEAGLGWEYRPERMSELIGARDTLTLVAHDAGRCVGFAVMAFGAERAHLVLLAVRPTHRRRGVASRMVEWLVQSAAAAGIASVHLELIDDNAAARAFYRASGFTETLRLPGYYRGRKAAMRMVRVLRSPSVRVEAWQPPPR